MTPVSKGVERLAVGKQAPTLVDSALKDFLTKNFTIVCGSMWPGDDEVLFRSLHSLDILPNLIWVPHELDFDHEKKVKGRLSSLGYKVVSFDLNIPLLSEGPLAIIVMKKGILAELYRLGAAAYVGGAFGSGVHSVWEPALCGIPVACGPRINRSPESKELIKSGVLTRICTDGELARWIEDCVVKKHGAQLQSVVNSIVEKHKGAATRIVALCESDKY